MKMLQLRQFQYNKLGTFGSDNVKLRAYSMLNGRFDSIG